jgi:hypothetical protein
MLRWHAADHDRLRQADHDPPGEPAHARVPSKKRSEKLVKRYCA